MSTANASNGRNESLDIAKGLGIFLVVLGHNWVVLGSMGELFRVVYSFHLPLFFLLAGVFIKEFESFGQLMRAKWDSLLKPYVVVLALLGVARLLAASQESPFDLWQYALGMAWGTGGTLQWVPLWFLPHLFIDLCFAHLIIGLRGQARYRRIGLFAVACALLCIGVQVIGILWRPAPGHPTPVGSVYMPGLPWSLDLAPMTMAFVLFGYLARERIRAGLRSVSWFVLSLVVFVALHCFSNETINLNERAFGQPLVCSLQAAAGIYLTLFIAFKLQAVDWLRRALGHLGRASLVVLIFHRFFQDKVFLLLSGMQQSEFVYSTASLIAGIVGPLLIFEIASRQALVAKLLLPRRMSHPTPQPTTATP